MFEEFLLKRPYGKRVEEPDANAQGEDAALNKVPLYLISKPVCSARGIGVHLIDDPSHSMLLLLLSLKTFTALHS
jgi:hypothetical protein